MKSRKVAGYVKAVQKRDALAAKLGALTLAFEEKTRPLRARLDAARVDVREREHTLNGGQLAAARREIERPTIPYAPRSSECEGSYLRSE